MPKNNVNSCRIKKVVPAQIVYYTSFNILCADKTFNTFEAAGKILQKLQCTEDYITFISKLLKSLTK